MALKPPCFRTTLHHPSSKNHPCINSVWYAMIHWQTQRFLEPRAHLFGFVALKQFKFALPLRLIRSSKGKVVGVEAGLPCGEVHSHLHPPLPTAERSPGPVASAWPCHLLFTQRGLLMWEWRGHPSLLCQNFILFPDISLWNAVCIFAQNNKRGLFFT